MVVESIETLEPVICADVENRNVPNKPGDVAGEISGESATGAPWLVVACNNVKRETDIKAQTVQFLSRI